MSTLFLIIGYAYLVGFLLLLGTMLRAPSGFEDRAGFHEGEELQSDS